MLLAMGRRSIGILSGSGPEAGVDLWGKILAANRALLGSAYRGDIDAPRVSIESVPRLSLSMDLAQRGEEVWSVLEREALALAERIDVLCIACNTLHYYQDRLRKRIGHDRLLSYVDVAMEQVLACDEPQVGLLAAGPVLDLHGSSAYGHHPQSHRLELPDDLAAAHRLIEAIKLRGAENEQVRGDMATLCAGYRSSTVLLACTELSLVELSLPGKRLVDVTREVAWRAAKLSLGL